MGSRWHSASTDAPSWQLGLRLAAAAEAEALGFVRGQVGLDDREAPGGHTAEVSPVPAARTRAREVVARRAPHAARIPEEAVSRPWLAGGRRCAPLRHPFVDV